MIELSTDFPNDKNAINQIVIPKLAIEILRKIKDVTGASNCCIAGGFLRGLYMQQHLSLCPEMNDIDIFSDLSVDKFQLVRGFLESEFGKPIRFHLGQFEQEEHMRGLIEFALPIDLKEKCSGVNSVQLNFGLNHPWAKAKDYICTANIGMNQIAVDHKGRVFYSEDFKSDMNNKTMTMNSNRMWNLNDWTRTKKSMIRMQTERPEFKGWKFILCEGPVQPIIGSFWDDRRKLYSELDIFLD